MVRLTVELGGEGGTRPALVLLLALVVAYVGIENDSRARRVTESRVAAAEYYLSPRDL